MDNWRPLVFTYWTMNVLTACGSCETIDQSASRMIDDVVTSTNEISWSEAREKVLSERTVWHNELPVAGVSVSAEVRTYRVPGTLTVAATAAVQVSALRYTSAAQAALFVTVLSHT